MPFPYASPCYESYLPVSNRRQIRLTSDFCINMRGYAEGHQKWPPWKQDGPAVHMEKLKITLVLPCAV